MKDLPECKLVLLKLDEKVDNFQEKSHSLRDLFTALDLM